MKQYKEKIDLKLAHLMWHILMVLKMKLRPKILHFQLRITYFP